jgi:hypothetical protein
MLAKCYIEVLGLDKHSDAAQRLVKWKQPVDGQVRWCSAGADLSLNHIRETLQEYATMR